ncbi:MAG: hypothetical protein DID89_2727548024 [Candidatus Nitrotoga sp. CP45]|nr:MAG: hypothetical protein DID89_2727548024 [Candidatus Nitrotoga sp. CP45]
MTSCFNVSQLRPLALCMQGSSLGYRSVSMLAKGETEGLIYMTRSSLQGGLKLPLLRVMVANHHGKKDTRMGAPMMSARMPRASLFFFRTIVRGSE